MAIMIARPYSECIDNDFGGIYCKWRKKQNHNMCAMIHIIDKFVPEHMNEPQEWSDKKNTQII